jgi:hypothetical protein
VSFTTARNVVHKLHGRWNTCVSRIADPPHLYPAASPFFRLQNRHPRSLQRAPSAARPCRSTLNPPSHKCTDSRALRVRRQRRRRACLPFCLLGLRFPEHDRRLFCALIFHAPFIRWCPWIRHTRVVPSSPLSSR